MSNRSPSTVKLWRKTRYQPTFWTRSGGEETSSTTRCMKTRKKQRKEISMIFKMHLEMRNMRRMRITTSKLRASKKKIKKVHRASGKTKMMVRTAVTMILRSLSKMKRNPKSSNLSQKWRNFQL